MLTNESFLDLLRRLEAQGHDMVALAVDGEVYDIPACQMAAMMNSVLQIKALAPTLTPEQDELRWTAPRTMGATDQQQGRATRTH